MLLAVGFFGGAAHAMPGFMYVGGMGPFDLLVVLLLVRWALLPPRRIEYDELALMTPFLLFCVFAYIGDFIGALEFGGNTLPGTLAPLRYLYYPTLFFTLRSYLRGPSDLGVLFVAYVLGVLAVCTVDLIRSTNGVLGVPQLFNPNVLGNFISYAMIALGFRFMPRSAIFKAGALMALFAFAMCTFSKATWLLAPVGIILNTMNVRRFVVPLLLIIAAVGVAIALSDFSQVIDVAYKTIDLKLTVSLDQGQAGGSTYMRLGFFISSMQTLIEYPFGIGLKNFAMFHHTHARELGVLFTESESPHTALGFVAVQAGWIGVVLFAIIVVRVIRMLYRMYDSSGLLTLSIISGMIFVSVCYQIEIITQPFIYLVTAAGLANARMAAAGNEERSSATGDAVTA